MLARRPLPKAYLGWNARWKAPFGPPWARELTVDQKLDPEIARQIGPFAYQPNNTTRAIEYPWAFEALRLSPGAAVLEVGGALAGFQFVVATTNATVTNVDPFYSYGGDDAIPTEPLAIHRRLNEIFQVDVRLIRGTLRTTEFPPDTFDRVVSISTLEHFDPEELEETAREIRRVLRPAGLVVLTIDLFLDVFPFTDELNNRWGTNISVASLVGCLEMEVIEGNRSELFGFPEFDPDRIRATLGDYVLGHGYPTLTQLVVLQK